MNTYPKVRRGTTIKDTNWRRDDNYTDEEMKWLQFVDKWRMKENHNMWPNMRQILILAKKFLLVLLFCPLCFALDSDLNCDCRVDYRDLSILLKSYPFDLRIYAGFADDWFKEDSLCLSSRQFQIVKKYNQLDFHSRMEMRRKSLIDTLMIHGVLKSQNKFDRILIGDEI
jgi:hypothetical protein